MRNKAVLLLATGLLCSTAGADDYYQQMERLKALDQRCEQARQAKLAPIRAGLVKECLKDRRKSQQDCEGEAMGYGESTTGPNNNVIQGMYYDLPECQQAAQAWKKWEESRPR
jgi:hypothetical protein